MDIGFAVIRGAAGNLAAGHVKDAAVGNIDVVILRNMENIGQSVQVYSRQSEACEDRGRLV